MTFSPATLSAATILAAAALGLGGCAGGENADSQVESASEAQATDSPRPSTSVPGASVRIVSPSDGEVIEGGEVLVTLEAEGVIILPAGDTTPGSGHHHLYLDEDLTDPSMPVPTVPGRIVHLGDGSSGYTFEGVEPGEHRLIAAVADFAHFPLRPLVVDTVRFTVR
jgi:hypothetical protein